MGIQNQPQTSILERIADGTLSLSSKKEYRNLLTLFPDKADIQRAYADFLFQEGDADKAYRYYLAAADQYTEDGKTFQAIVSKILAWRIVKPTHQEGRSFHAALKDSLLGESPLQKFFNDMPYPEFVATMLKLVRVLVPAGETVIEAGAESDALYFIVSGELQEIRQNRAPGGGPADPRESLNLSDNDIFGEVLPLDQTNHSRFQVRTVTASELVKISKPALKALSRKYPLIEKLLAGLYKGASDADKIRTWASVRRSTRYATPVKIKLTLSPSNQTGSSLTVEAMSKDISLGGVCLDLGFTREPPSPGELFGTAAVVEVDLPDTDGSLTVNGRLVWSKLVKEPGGTALVVGVKFEKLGRETRDLLKVYCFGIENEQALMWSLWETYME